MLKKMAVPTKKINKSNYLPLMMHAYILVYTYIHITRVLFFDTKASIEYRGLINLALALLDHHYCLLSLLYL